MKLYSKTKSNYGVNLYQVQRGSKRMYFDGMFEAHELCIKLRTDLIDNCETGVVRLLVCQFKRRGQYHWSKLDVIDVLNGVHGWKIVCDYHITKGVPTKWVDRRRFSGVLNVTPEEYTAQTAFPSARHKAAVEYVASNIELDELCRRSPSRTAFRVALQKVGELKPPLSKDLANYVWLWYKR